MKGKIILDILPLIILFVLFYLMFSSTAYSWIEDPPGSSNLRLVPNDIDYRVIYTFLMSVTMAVPHFILFLAAIRLLRGKQSIFENIIAIFVGGLAIHQRELWAFYDDFRIIGTVFNITWPVTILLQIGIGIWAWIYFSRRNEPNNVVLLCVSFFIIFIGPVIIFFARRDKIKGIS